MRVPRHSSLLLLSLILSACGGGGSSSTPATTAQGSNTTTTTTPTDTTPTQTTPAQNNTPRVIDYYGDSTIRGCETNTNCGSQAPETAPQAFDAALPTTPSHTVHNEGVDSTDACQLLNGTDGKHPAWEQQMSATPATTHVIINHGINDLLHAQTGQGDDHSLAQYQQCLTSLVTIAKNHNKQVILETPNPITAGDLTTYVQTMRSVASSLQVPVIDQFAFLSATYGSNIGSTVPDTLHPTDAVYVQKGQFAAKAFQQACGNFTCIYTVVSN
jgi:lysophospholipase L1-like esterase